MVTQRKRPEPWILDLPARWWWGRRCELGLFAKRARNSRGPVLVVSIGKTARLRSLMSQTTDRRINSRCGTGYASIKARACLAFSLLFPGDGGGHRRSLHHGLLWQGVTINTGLLVM